MNQQLIFTMKFDPSDLTRLAQMITSAIGGGGGGGTSGSGGSSGGASQKGATSWTIAKGILIFEAIKKSVEGIVKNSSVANSYLGAMGKVFGAAIDLLLLPFLPIFNLLLVGLGKLVEWLSRDDVQKALEKVGNWIVDRLKDLIDVVKWLWGAAQEVYGWVKGAWNELKPVLEPIAEALKSVAKALDKASGGWLGDTAGKVGDTFGKIGGALVGANILAGVASLSKLPIISQLGGLFFKGEGAIAKGAAKAGGGILDAVGIGGIAKVLGGGAGLIGAAYSGGQVGNWLNNKITGSNNSYGVSDFIDQYTFGYWRRKLFGGGDAEASAGNSITPPNVGDAGLKSSGAYVGSQNITINIYEASDAKKVADQVKNELSKVARSITLR